MKIKPGIPELIFGPIALLLIFLMGFVVGSSPHPSEPAEQKGAAKTDNTTSYYEPYYAIRDWFGKDAAGFFTALLFAVGFGQAALFYVQLRLIRTGLKPAEEAAKAATAAAEALPRLERAYIFIQPKISLKTAFIMYGETSGTIPDNVGVEFLITNHGKTPAIIMSMDIRCDFWTSAPDNSQHIPSKLLGNEVVLEAGKSLPEERITIKQFLNPDAVKALAKGDAYVWFSGSILYNDIFGEQRRTSFRHRYGSIMRVMTASGGTPYNERT
jgi:hypothetical protein